ncbi:hypothetical protein BFJ63_vAg17395 [Fusarium oxysporum f. sp. narcissi]|uniref:ATP-dependent DNA helicase n=1 Tax=Fusarium oxysporum f. sp. narcissi TaxID=451672 RepID=A0A4Q2V0W5_FUSOX|nr:hypothetical protein BFJ63_vAg17395 [Fusarium oxysporum f. sp. narcissi]
METESLSDLFRRLDARNRENVALAGLGIRTSADIFEAIQNQYEHSSGQRIAACGGTVDSPALANLGIRTSTDILEALNGENGQESRDVSSQRRHRPHQTSGTVSSGQSQIIGGAKDTVGNGSQEQSRHGNELKRSGPRGNDGQLPRKRTRTVGRQERSQSEEADDLADVLRVLEEEFAEKERLSDDQTWCMPVSHERKVKTVEEFYKAFHDVRTLPVLTCMFCYRKHSRAELQYVDWDWWVANAIEKRDGSPFKCVECFPVGQKILGCADCVRHLGRGALSVAARLHTQLGCEHMFPDELKDLTPVEEKLIALNSCYGFITKYSRPDGHRQSARYPKHIKGHITVFPNSVQELAENVLPHPLLKVLNEIHVSWQGSKKPVPSDLSALLSVRRRVVEKALLWLKRHNPLYAEININTAELRSWDSPPHGVPSQIYDRLERNEPSAQEKSQTGQLVPPIERGLDDEGSVDIREVLATLGQGNDWEASHEVLAEPSNEDGDAAVGMVHEISSSGMFALDGGPNVAESEKLRYVGDALNGQDPHDKAGGSVLTGSAEVRQGHTSEPYILVSRGEDFADSFDPRFFAKTFPTLLPLGDGGPRQAEESIDNGVLEENRNVEADIRVGGLISSRNMTLEAWAKVVLQRHDGRFATHHIFSFLVFNMGVRSRNRRVSMLSVTRNNFPEVQRIVRSLTAERLQLAKAELETVGRTGDEDVKQLLKSLSLYGFRQPMSGESRLSMRRKIKSDIIRDGIPAIWFTLNPNDITNPVKLKLAAYRKRDPDEAEAFLTSLDLAYKRTRLAISDPLSSAIFFHREVTMFFNHYVNTGKESVFGRISRYFGAVETNERGSLHMHGLLWLRGNMHLTSILRDVEGEDKAAYRERIIQQQFAAAFDEEANFCAGATQIHTHSPTCVKYAIRGRGKRRDPCRFKAPWRLAERTAFTDEGVLQIRRTHSMVNRWNKAMAVGLRHNHDVSFIATQCKTLAIVFYVTNYATKVEDPVWKRVAAAAGLFPDTDEPIVDHSQAGNVDRGRNQVRHFLMKVANRIFTERALSQVEVVAHLLGYPTEFASNDAWAFLNVSSLYWHIFRLWRHLRRESGMEVADEPLEETVFLEEGGERISPVQAYPHRGKLLEGPSLYDYMSIVKLKRKGKGAGTRGEVQLDRSWHPSQIWVQALRKPGEHAVVCFDGYLSTDWSEVTEGYYKRAAVQHLALFVPWESFLFEGGGDINAIWEGQRRALPRRILFVVDNIQLLHRSAEDAKRDANQWAAQSGGGGGDVDASVDTAGLECDTEPQAAYRSDGVGQKGRPQRRRRCRGKSMSKSIKSQQTSASREKEKMIQGIQNQPDSDTAGHESAVCNMLNGFGEHEVRHTATDSETIGRCVRPSTTIEFGSSTSFSEAGRQLSRSFALNRKQGIAVQLICRQLDHVHRDESGTPQLCQFIGGEGGTGKSRVISTITELFASKGISHRLLVTATAGTAAANIDGITIHSACGFSKDTAPRGGRGSDVDGFAASSSASFRVDGRSTAQWQEKWLLIIDEVSMLGARTLYAVNEQLRKLRGRARDFGGIPIVVFCGDFHQFRPVQERSILLPSAAISWNEEKSFKSEQRYQHDRAHALWKRFTTVIMLDEQVRAASDPQLQRLLTRVRRGVQNRSDMELLNRTCYREKRRIVWAPGLTVVTPLNRNRWNLNIELSLCFRKNRQSLLRIFVSEHRWKEGKPTEEEAVMMLGQGDDSAVPVPAIFMFVPGMPVVVNKNTHQGLKLVNGASYTALDIIVDKAHPGHRVNEETVLHFGPPAGIVLASETTRDFHFVGMPAGTVLLTPISTMIECQKKRPWQRKNVSRRGLPCAAAFACTDYKVQSKTLNRVVLELRGARTTNIDGEAVPVQCDPYSLYVQLSRCRTLRGISLLSEVRERDFVGNRVPENMVAAEEKLERLSDKTIRDAACWDWSEQN